MNGASHPQAVKAVRKLEDKALKCITIAQSLLPGAPSYIIERQATDLMPLKEKSIQIILRRQRRYNMDRTASSPNISVEQKKVDREEINSDPTYKPMSRYDMAKKSKGENNE